MSRRAVRMLALLAAVGVVAAALATACGEAGEEVEGTATATGTAAEGEGPVVEGSLPLDTPADVTLNVEAGTAAEEFRIVVAEGAEGPAGVVRFEVANNAQIVHEFEVLKDGEELGEIENLGPGQSAVLVLELEPGTYEFACRLPGHYEAGMHTDFVMR